MLGCQYGILAPPAPLALWLCCVAHPLLHALRCAVLRRRTGVDMMNIRVLVGYLVQKLARGLTQVRRG